MRERVEEVGLGVHLKDVTLGHADSQADVDPFVVGHEDALRALLVVGFLRKQVQLQLVRRAEVQGENLSLFHDVGVPDCVLSQRLNLGLRRYFEPDLHGVLVVTLELGRVREGECVEEVEGIDLKVVVSLCAEAADVVVAPRLEHLDGDVGDVLVGERRVLVAGSSDVF